MSLDPFSQRRAGILLHPTSLPGFRTREAMGKDAYAFIDLLVSCGQTVWQVLPLSPPDPGGSPYNAISAHAGNIHLISVSQLIADGWLTPGQRDHAHDISSLLLQAHQGFKLNADTKNKAAFELFCHNNAYWLDDFALYSVLRAQHNGCHWLEWPEKYRQRETDALADVRQKLHVALEQVCFEQFVFFQQWQRLKSYANEKGVLMFGDMPIFVAHDSADVWANQLLFDLHDDGTLRVVAGVPPDYFSATGQRWGNPLYRWDLIEADQYSWWINRVKTLLNCFDMVRIDHFRGFESYWEIPAEEETAINGRWVKAPGKTLFQVLRRQFKNLPFVAEDLGFITEEVESLRRRLNFPGMKILQFAFDSDEENPYLLHNHEPWSVVYTGTHDNNTSCGWYADLNEDVRLKVNDYLGLAVEPGADDMPWPLIRCAYASVSRLAIIPLQDLLVLDGDHRMNTPGTVSGNWQWHFEWHQLDEKNIVRLAHMAKLYGRF